MKNLGYKIFGVLMLAAALLTSACNSKEEEGAEQAYVSAESVAVTNFYLMADSRVMRNLDSVFFSIDLERGVIFNADSLPKGTNITKLMPKISYPSTVTGAVIEMKGGTHRPDGQVNYYVNPNDTIDFTAQVTLTLSAGDALSKTYRLKVNVHKQDPDTLYWSQTASMRLPSRMDNPKAQKSVALDETVYTLIEEADGTFTMAHTNDIFAGVWTKTALQGGLNPVVASMSVTKDGTLYLLSDDGKLMSSADGVSWTAEDTGWTQIIGPYGDALLGAKANGSSRNLVCWPEGVVPEMALPEDFPTSGYSVPVEFSNRWTPLPTIMIFGGDRNLGGNSASWAFDGSQWADLANTPLPALDGVAVVKYFAYLKGANNAQLKEYDALVAFGGRLPDGSVNKTVYISYDQGITWLKGPQNIQLPSGVSAGYMADALALSTEMEASLGNKWNARRRVNFEIDGNTIKWDCPYIFLFGGYDSAGALNPEIRSGVLRRLTFAPLF